MVESRQLLGTGLLILAPSPLPPLSIRPSPVLLLGRSMSG